MILGQPNFPDTLDLALSAPNVVTIYGKDWSFGWMGRGLCACDINGDGYDEIIVAATALTNAEIYVIEGNWELPRFGIDSVKDFPFAARTLPGGSGPAPSGAFFCCRTPQFHNENATPFPA